MMNPYLTLSDGTEIVHSQLIFEGEMEKVIVDFKRQTDKGIDFARCELPEYKWTCIEGYSNEEINFFASLLYHNMHQLFEFAATRANPINNKIIKAILIGLIMIVIAVVLYTIIYAFSSFFSMSSFERSMYTFLNQ